MKAIAASALTAAVLASSALAGKANSVKFKTNIAPITVKGNAFWNGKERFYLRGIDYQPGWSSNLKDPIAEPRICKRDIAKFKELGVNTIRVYSVDNSVNHDECMEALADAGIYLALDVNTPKYSLSRTDPNNSYNAAYLQNVFATVEMFAKYDNTLAFFSGNEVINDGNSSKAAPYVKAVTRDIHKFLHSRNMRSVPVGYSAADVDTNRVHLAQYMNCGSGDERSDFFAFNDFSWCDPPSVEKSGWDKKVQAFTGYGIPLFLSENGCNRSEHNWNEVTALYSSNITSVFSGGLVYEYSPEPDNFGLVQLKDGKLTKLPDFDKLKEAFANAKTPSGDGGFNKTGGANPCPKKDVPNWYVGDEALPTMPEGAKIYLLRGAGDGVGFAGNGSQTAGSGSPGPGSGANGVKAGQPFALNTQGAAAGLRPPKIASAFLLCSIVVGASKLFGVSLIVV
uniref:1,3-beta-glucanosyltransferase n=1 Tax=Paracoccidioides brasiliensis TaxID=121759 RepID=Q6U1P5_PARBR|nr:beta-1,3-glucanosyltransferase 1 [Paracoccidioides brasiliensis]ABA33783.2 beta-1,3-glucanosyltransferase 1 [Paracoccidioides brasiliensis]